jgi:hypothetical protein
LLQLGIISNFLTRGGGQTFVVSQFMINEAKVIYFRLILLLEINQKFIKVIISQYSFLESCKPYNLEDDSFEPRAHKGSTRLRQSFCTQWIINFLQSML